MGPVVRISTSPAVSEHCYFSVHHLFLLSHFLTHGGNASTSQTENSLESSQFHNFPPLPLASVGHFRFPAQSVYGNAAQMMMGMVGLIEVVFTSLCFLFFPLAGKTILFYYPIVWNRHICDDVETHLSPQYCKTDNTVTSLPVRICQKQRAVYLFLSDILHLSIKIRHLVRPLLSLRPASCDKTSTDSLLFA